MERKSLVILDFWAGWCAPCRALSPILDKLASEYSHIDLQKFDVEDDANAELVAQYKVTSLPKVLALVDGEVVKTISGAKPYGALIQELSEWL